MTIRLFLSPTKYIGPDGAYRAWMADFDDAEIQELFDGTVTLPTPFTDQTPTNVILAQVRERNPDAIVYLGTSNG